MAPTPPAPSLAGRWTGNTVCPVSVDFDLTVTASARDQYTIIGHSTLGDGTGWISGQQVHFEGWVLVNRVAFNGTLTSPTTMGGKVSESIGLECPWFATKR